MKTGDARAPACPSDPFLRAGMPHAPEEGGDIASYLPFMPRARLRRKGPIHARTSRDDGCGCGAGARHEICVRPYPIILFSRAQSAAKLSPPPTPLIFCSSSSISPQKESDAAHAMLVAPLPSEEGLKMREAVNRSPIAPSFSPLFGGSNRIDPLLYQFDSLCEE